MNQNAIKPKMSRNVASSRLPSSPPWAPHPTRASTEDFQNKPLQCVCERTIPLLLVIGEYSMLLAATKVRSQGYQELPGAMVVTRQSYQWLPNLSRELPGAI
ncbi:hypothetical protein B0H13DRAFT_1853574 [Mycena leptocephala]|nr:hypothetical protein B0H13DRAFT_1853574 [Mycena leptocephala]